MRHGSRRRPARGPLRSDRPAPGSSLSGTGKPATHAYVCGLLAALFIAVPALEIYVILEVGGRLGSLATLAIIVLTGLLGASLARHQGLAAMRELRASLAHGEAVGRSLVAGVLVLIAAAFLLTPGFVTDAVGFTLLVPPVRHLVAELIARRYAAQLAVRGFGAVVDPGLDGRNRPDDHDPPPPGVIDV